MSGPSEKILTLHPEGKKGTNISLQKYNVIKSFILKSLSDFGEISYKDLNLLGRKVLGSSFEGSVVWYIVTVKLDLEARGIIERIASKKGHKIKLKSKQ